MAWILTAALRCRQSAGSADAPQRDVRRANMDRLTISASVPCQCSPSTSILCVTVGGMASAGNEPTHKHRRDTRARARARALTVRNVKSVGDSRAPSGSARGGDDDGWLGPTNVGLRERKTTCFRRRHGDRRLDDGRRGESIDHSRAVSHTRDLCSRGRPRPRAWCLCSLNSSEVSRRRSELAHPRYCAKVRPLRVVAAA